MRARPQQPPWRSGPADVIVHLAAQAGVRYSIENPRAYVDANIVGTFNVMEAARRPAGASADGLDQLGLWRQYRDALCRGHKADTQMSFYAATKKANEAMAHSWAHIHGLPTTMFRFFTVYGPWGRPDMALFKFTRGHPRRASRSTSTTTARCGATSPMSTTWCAASGC
jgi:UDP-glucuronate 4-epimerase